MMITPAKTGGYLARSYSKRQLAELVIELNQENKRLKQKLQALEKEAENEQD